MHRARALYAICNRGMHSMEAYVKLQWLMFYAAVFLALMLAMFSFFWILSRAVSRIMEYRTKRKYDRELKEHIFDRDEMIKCQEKRWENMQARLLSAEGVSRGCSEHTHHMREEVVSLRDRLEATRIELRDLREALEELKKAPKKAARKKRMSKTKKSRSKPNDVTRDSHM